MKIRKPGDTVICEVADAAVAQKLVDSGKWEEYVAVDETLNPDGSVEKHELKGEDLDADVAAVEAEIAAAATKDRGKEIQAQYRNQSDAEVAEFTRALAPVLHSLKHDIPETLAKSMDQLLKQQVGLPGGLDQLRLIAKQAELERYGIKSPTDRIGLGTWTRKQANLFYLSAFRMMRGNPPLAEADADELVSKQLRSEFGGQDSVRQAGSTEGTGSAGGYTVPEDHQIEIIKDAMHRTVIWPACSVRPTNRDVVRRPVRSAVGDVNYGSEAAAELANVTEVTITYAEKTWTMRPFDAYFPVSVELMNDSAVNIESEITEAAGEQFAEQQERMPIQGHGSTRSEPVGIMHQSGISSTAVSAALTVDNLLTLVYGVNIRYRQDTLANLLALLPTYSYKGVVLDAAKNYYNIDILNLPKLVENEFVTEGNAIIGAFANYWIYQNPTMQMISQMIAKSKGLDIVFWQRWDGQAVHVGAFYKGTSITYA